MSETWQGQYRSIISKVIKRLEDNVQRDTDDFTYSGGLSGQLVALTCLAEHEANYQLDRDLVEDGLWRMLTAFPTQPQGLFQGSTGLMFCALELDRYFDFGIVEDAAHELDTYLFDCFKHEQNLLYHYDLISGTSGLIVYAAYRAQSTNDNKLLYASIDHLKKMATHDEHGSHWFSPPDWGRGTPMGNSYPLGCLDMGMAHGQPGALASLAYAIASGYDQRPGTSELLRNAIKTLRHYDHDQESGHFGTAAGDPGVPRCAWCYGDFGAASALQLAALALKSPELDTWANRILQHMSRRHIESLGFADAYLCHGTAGCAWIMRQLSSKYEANAMAWSELHLDGGVFSVEACLVDPNYNLGILEGVSGAALTFSEALGNPSALHWSLPFMAGQSSLRQRLPLKETAFA